MLTTVPPKRNLENCLTSVSGYSSLRSSKNNDKEDKKVTEGNYYGKSKFKRISYLFLFILILIYLFLFHTQINIK